MLTTVSRRFGPDFTTESTEITETDRKERRVRIRIRNPFFPASVARGETPDYGGEGVGV